MAEEIKKTTLADGLTAMREADDYEDFPGLVGYALEQCIMDPCISFTELGKKIIDGAEKYSDFENMLSCLTGRDTESFLDAVESYKGDYAELGSVPDMLDDRMKKLYNDMMNEDDNSEDDSEE